MKKNAVTFYTLSDEDTVKLGQRLGRVLQRGDVIALIGDLGSGKTCLAKGIGLGLGVSPDMVITSPSFSLVNEYEGRLSFYHMDGYRLEDLSDFLAAGLEEYLHQDGVAAVEWADRWPEILPEWSVTVEIRIVDARSRKITLSGHHPRAFHILKEL